jgi:hypothetical protein
MAPAFEFEKEIGKSTFTVIAPGGEWGVKHPTDIPEAFDEIKGTPPPPPVLSGRPLRSRKTSKRETIKPGFQHHSSI